MKKILQQYWIEFWKTLFKDSDVFFLFSPVFLAVGIHMYFYYYPSVLTIKILFLTALILTSFFLYLYNDIAIVINRVILLCIVGVFAGFLQTYTTQHTVLKKREVGIINAVVEKIYYAPDKTRIVLNSVTMNNRAITGKVQLTIKQTVEQGSKISARVMLYPPASPVIPKAFDFRYYAYYKNIVAYGRVLSDFTVIKSGKNNLNTTLTQYLYEILPKNTAGITVALLTGNRNGIAEKDLKSLRGSGLAHLLAISGLHIGLVIGGIYFVLRLLLICLLGTYSAPYPVKKTSAILALLAGAGYCVMANFPIPTVRAFLMASIVILGLLTNKRVFTIRSVVIVAILILLVNPISLYSPSFQLSFAAVTGLVLFYQKHTNIKKGILGFFINVFLSSLVAMLSTMPFAIYHFGTVAIYSVVANMIAIPLMSFLIAPALMLSFLEYSIFAKSTLFNVSGIGIEWLVEWSDMIFSLSKSVLHFGKIPSLTLVFICLGLYIFVNLTTSLRKIGVYMFIVGLILSLYTKPKPIAFISQSKKLVIRYGDNLQDYTYKTPSKIDKYLQQAIRLETGLPIKKINRCKQEICIYNAVAYVKKYADTFNICNSKTLKLIVAPRQYIRNCNVPSLDKFDLYYYSYVVYNTGEIIKSKRFYIPKFD